MPAQRASSHRTTDLVREIERHNLVLDSLANSSSSSVCAPRERRQAVERLFVSVSDSNQDDGENRNGFRNTISAAQGSNILRFTTFGELPDRRSRCVIATKAQYCREVERKASIANFLRPRDAYTVSTLLPDIVTVRKKDYQRVEMKDGYRYLMECSLVEELVGVTANTTPSLIADRKSTIQSPDKAAVSCP